MIKMPAWLLSRSAQAIDALLSVALRRRAAMIASLMYTCYFDRLSPFRTHTRFAACVVALYVCLLPSAHQESLAQDALADATPNSELVARARGLVGDVRAGRQSLEVPGAIEFELKRQLRSVKNAEEGLRQSVKMYASFERLALEVSPFDDRGLTQIFMYAKYMQREADRMAAFRQSLPRLRARCVELQVQLIASRMLEPERNPKREIEL